MFWSSFPVLESFPFSFFLVLLAPCLSCHRFISVAFLVVEICSMFRVLFGLLIALLMYFMPGHLFKDLFVLHSVSRLI